MNNYFHSKKVHKIYKTCQVIHACLSLLLFLLSMIKLYGKYTARLDGYESMIGD